MRGYRLEVETQSQASTFRKVEGKGPEREEG